MGRQFDARHGDHAPALTWRDECDRAQALADARRRGEISDGPGLLAGMLVFAIIVATVLVTGARWAPEWIGLVTIPAGGVFALLVLAISDVRRARR